MLFSDRIPEKVIEQPNVAQFCSVLDNLQMYKIEMTSHYHRTFNPAILNDKKWLFKMLSDYGFDGLPFDLPLGVLQLLCLNIDKVMRLKGSKLGLELFLSVLTLGEVTVDDSKFYTESAVVILDSLEQGFILQDSDDRKLVLLDNSSQIELASTLSVTIKSKYFSGAYSSAASAMKNYISNNIKDFIPFMSSNVSITYSSNSDFYYHKELNQYFV